MSPTSMHCPHCSVILRIRDRKFIGREVDCPDCHNAILVLADGPRELLLQKVESESLAGTSVPAKNGPVRGLSETSQIAKKQRPVRRTSQAGQPKPAVIAANRFPKWVGLLTTTTGIAWTVATTATVILLGLAWPFGMGDTNDAPTVTGRSSPNQRPVAAADIGQTVGPSQVENSADDLQARMQRLGQQVMGFVSEHERYPASPAQAANLTERQRLSWMAELAAESATASGIRPQWDQPWRDPLNDRFVRRTIPTFLNPGMKATTGLDGYPVSHFVGIAGVGADGPHLPVDHPRAGIFGFNRRTRVDDIKDGRANTMLVAGVTGNIGGWAGGGPATMRPLTAEPYINGPDGFGVGRKDGMPVLMADGSVRFLSANTDPRLLRRMAAMADGLPLDLKTPGEPGGSHPRSNPDPGKPLLTKLDVPQPLPQPPPANKAPTPSDPPVVAPVPQKVIDVDLLLSQKILRYELQRAVSFRVVLREIEEMAGFPIRVDKDKLGEFADRLETPISIGKLQETTVGKILDILIEQAGLVYVIQQDGISIEAASPNETDPTAPKSI